MKKVKTPSEQLRAWRAYCRLTPSQVAQYTGIPESTIDGIEQGLVYPDIQTADRLNRFFAQYPAAYNQNLQTQQMRSGASHPGPGSPGYGVTPSSQSYSGIALQQPAQSYPAPISYQPAQSYPAPVPYQPAQSYPAPVPYQTMQSYPGVVATQQPMQSYPASIGQQQVVQSYPAQQTHTQTIYNNSYIPPATVQQSRYYAQTQRAQTYLGLTVAGAVFQLIVFMIPFIFLFFPFMDLLIGVKLGGVTVGSVHTVMKGAMLFAYPYYAFSFAALAAQIGLWITLLSGLAMIILSVLRIFGFDFFNARTICFYAYLLGIIACFIGLSVAAVDEVARWAFVAYTLTAVVALVSRIILDGGMRAFAIQR